MKTIIQTASVALLVVCTVGCASTKAYFADRGRDAGDVLALGVEWPVAGISVQAGPLLNGVIMAGGPLNGCRGYGLFAGEFGAYEFFEIETVLLGGKEVRVNSDRGKDYDVSQFLSFPIESRLFSRHGAQNSVGKCEVRIGAGVGILAGVDFLELGDFVLGWFGVDLFDDDVQSRKQEKKSNQSIQSAFSPARKK